jgi:photosystem II stability/assembly factor-like uncharacterized protein
MRKPRLRHALATAAAAVLAALSLPAAAGAGVSVGHSGWEWSNPLPQGNPIRALDFEQSATGGTGYAAGGFGTLLVSEDGGSSWRGIPSGVTEDLTELEALGEGTLVVGGGCRLLRSDQGGSDLGPLPWGSTSRCRSPIAGLSFPSKDVGYVAREDGRLYRTGDGGHSWNRMEPVPLSEGQADAGGGVVTDVAFATQDGGFASTSDGLYRTSDGGATWELALSRPGLNALYFATPEVGYVVGSGLDVFKTIDGGRTWMRKAVNVPDVALALASITCANEYLCLAATGGDRLYRTADGGDNWSVVRLLPGQAAAAAFASPTRAVSAGEDGTIVLSADGGLTWSAVGSTLAGSFTQLSGASGSLAFALGSSGAIAKTVDGGASWSYLEPPSGEAVLDVSFPDDSNGFALDAVGSLFRTYDGGFSWQPLAGGGSNPPQAVLALDEDRVFLVGSRGVRRSDDGGLTFRAVRRQAVRRAGLFDIDYAGGWLYAYGPTSLFASRDGGKSWRKLKRPDHRPLAIVDFVGSRLGFALGKGGRLWRTGDQGRRWGELLGAGTDGVSAVAFRNAREGYLIASDIFFERGSDRPDYVLRTSNGGATWRPQLVANSRDVTGILATRDRTDFLLAGHNELFATTSGGDSGRRSRLRARAGRKRVSAGRTVAIEGSLSPAAGGEQVVVSKTSADPRGRHGANDWSFKLARVRSDGTFSTRWKVRQTSVFVAQWTGDGRRSGAGSKVVKVRVSGG